MATLALSVAGAGLGQLTGIGASTGWMLGSTLGRILTRDEGNSGSNLSALKVTGASYGAPIPQVFGTMRLGGTVIWLGGVRDYQSGQSGGKGSLGGSTISTSGSYRVASIAVAVSEGEMDAVLKIWADGVLIFNAEGTGERQISGLSFRFYGGNDSQLTDSVMSGIEAADNVPAYRGISYIVFEDLNLSSFGNRIPNFEFLVSREAIAHYPSEVGESASYVPTQLIMDTDRADLVSYETTGTNKLRRIDLTSLTVVNDTDVGSTFPTLPHAYRGLSRDRNGNIWVGSGYAMLAGRKIHRFNPFLMVEEASADLPTGVGALSWSVDINEPLSGVSFQVAGSQQSAQVVVLDQDLQTVDVISVESLGTGGAVRDAQEQAWVAMTANDTVRKFDDLQIVRVSLFSRTDPSGAITEVKSEIFKVLSNDLTPGNPSEVHNVCRLLRYSQGHEELIFQNEYRLFKWSITTQSVSAIRDGDFSTYEFIGDPYEGRELVFLKNERWVVYLSEYDLSEIAQVDLYNFEDVGSLTGAGYDAVSDSVIVLSNGNPLRRLFLRRQSGAGADYQVILSTLCSAAGLSAEQYDVSEVSSATDGFVVTRPMQVKDALAPLLLAGRLNVIESGDQLVFRGQERDSQTSIALDDMLDQPSSRRLQESELPLEITASYLATDGGHQPGVQSSRRSRAPHATMSGKMQENLTLPMALTADDAKVICFAALSDAWQERHLKEMRLPSKYLALEPGDEVSVAASGSGIQFEGRLSETHVGTDISLDVQSVGASRFDPLVVPAADAGAGYVALPIRQNAASALLILDAPLLRDEDATAGEGSRLYLGIRAQSRDTWQGAEIYRSMIGDRYDLMQRVSQNVSWGVAVNALPSPQSPWRTDRENSLEVRFVEDDPPLENISQLEMLNGANALMLGAELIQFSSVELMGDGSYKLSNLLRGRRGTDYAVESHKVGEIAVLITPETLSRAVLPLSAIGQRYFYKAPSLGRYLEEAPIVRHAHLGRDLMPYSPVHVKNIKTDTSLTVQWVRRSRVGASGLSEALPLAERSERYEIVIGYGANTQSHFVSEGPEFTYSLSQFNLDFGLTLGELPVLSLEIFQLSETIGRGFSVKETV